MRRRSAVGGHGIVEAGGIGVVHWSTAPRFQEMCADAWRYSGGGGKGVGKAWERRGCSHNGGKGGVCGDPAHERGRTGVGQGSDGGRTGFGRGSDGGYIGRAGIYPEVRHDLVLEQHHSRVAVGVTGAHVGAAEVEVAVHCGSIPQVLTPEEPNPRHSTAATPSLAPMPVAPFWGVLVWLQASREQGE